MATQLKEPDPVEAEEVEQPQTEGRDFEAEARVKGWRPKEEFTGKGEWVDAEAFLQRADDNLGLSRAEKEQMRKRISVLESSLKKLTKLEQRSYQTAMDDITGKMEAAVESGDLGEFRSLFEKLKGLQKDVTEKPEDRQAEAIEAFDTFREDNGWYDKGNLASATEADISARIYADRMMEKHVKLTETMEPAAFFAHIEGLVKDKYPLLGKAARAKPASDVAGVTAVGGKPKGKVGANLPPEAKAAAERYMRQKIGAFGKCTTKAEAYDLFAKDYEWDEK